MATILYVDDEPAVGTLLAHSIRRAGHEPVGASSVAEALQVVARGGVDLIVSDHQMPGRTGLDLLEALQRDGYDIPLIILTGYASLEPAVAAVRKGALDYITKPVDAQQLELAIDQALAVVKLRRENATLREEVSALRQRHAIVGESPSIQRALNDVAMAAPTRASVLLLGESGTGKELFARAIHEQSDRRGRPFIRIDCAAIPEHLFESALFGHEQGAVTDAAKRVEGAFERAHQGTLLLQEVSAMGLELQARLLRVLQAMEFERVGGSTKVRVDVRIIATSNRDLAAEAAAGRFRQDLFFRLSVIPIQIPPLRERTDDIPRLATRFAMRAAEEYGRPVTGIAQDAMDWLRAQPWPGNVRELQHTVERAVVLAHEPILPLHRFLGSGARTTTPAAAAHLETDDGAVVLHSLRIADAEDALIQTALARTQGNRTHAAELLGISLRTLRSRLNAPSK